MKSLLEFGPLALFVGVYYFSEPEQAFFTATAVLVVSSIIALGLYRFKYGNVPVAPLVSTVIVVLLGGLTLYLQDKTFLKIKPTLVYLLFATTLATGLFMKKPLLKYVIGQAIQMNDSGWTALTLRWIGFFVAMAIANEIVWRNFSESFWVNFKFFGALPLTFLFGICQIPLMQRHGFKLEPDADNTSDSQSD